MSASATLRDREAEPTALPSSFFTSSCTGAATLLARTTKEGRALLLRMEAAALSGAAHPAMAAFCVNIAACMRAVLPIVQRPGEAACMRCLCAVPNDVRCRIARRCSPPCALLRYRAVHQRNRARNWGCVGIVTTFLNAHRLKPKPQATPQ